MDLCKVPNLLFKMQAAPEKDEQNMKPLYDIPRTQLVKQLRFSHWLKDFHSLGFKYFNPHWEPNYIKHLVFATTLFIVIFQL